MQNALRDMLQLPPLPRVGEFATDSASEESRDAHFLTILPFRLLPQAEIRHRVILQITETARDRDG